MSCPQTKTRFFDLGMKWTEEYMWFDGFPDKAEKSGTHPYVTDATTFKTWFCHYVPVDMSEC